MQRAHTTQWNEKEYHHTYDFIQDEDRHQSCPLERGTTSELELIHEQLPLPVPCYDLLPVTELTFGPREARLRVLPAPLS